MPLLEIKGLSDTIRNVKEGISGVRGAAASVNTQAAGLKAELEDIDTQLRQHRDDLKFEAETLGNSGDQSSGSEESKKPIV